ncbi:MAG: DUF6580 family putative transport protein [Planctomycetota bacterium]
MQLSQEAAACAAAAAICYCCCSCRIAACAAASSALFFVVTNFAVWSAGGWYADNFAGLMACYAAALPFARNMLAGDLVWSAAMFAGLALMENRSAIAKTAVAEA